jgi:RHS repeat-associated protein
MGGVMVAIGACVARYARVRLRGWRAVRGRARTLATLAAAALTAGSAAPALQPLALVVLAVSALILMAVLLVAVLLVPPRAEARPTGMWRPWLAPLVVALILLASLGLGVATATRPRGAVDAAPLCLGWNLAAEYRSGTARANPNPDVSINASGEFRQASSIGWPAGAVLLHPLLNQLAVVGWRSPLAGTVTIVGAFRDLDPNNYVDSNGIDWSIDRGATPLAQGAYANGGAQTFSLTATVAVGETLYFTVGPQGGNHYNDSTQLDLRITPPDPTDTLHHCALSTPWATHAGQGLCVTFGTFLMQQADIALPGRGPTLALARTYHSADPTDSGFGPGWSFTYGMSVTPELSGTLLVRLGDGRRDRYTDAGGGNYTPPTGIYDTLVKSADGTYTLTTPEQFVHRFDASGRLASIADRNGLTTRLTWTSTGLTVTDPGGREVALLYGTGADSQHFVRITDTSLSPARVVEYGYDPATGDLTSVRDVRGQTWRLTYENHRLRTLADPMARVVLENTYNAEGKVVQQRDGNTVAGTAVIGNRQALTFDYATAGQTKVGDRRNSAFITTYHYDATFRVTGITDAKNGLRANLTWDTRNDLVCTADHKGNRTGYKYDLRGNVERVTPADNADAACAPRDPALVYDFAYNARNDIETATAPLTQTATGPIRSQTSYQYDGNGNLTIETLPLGHSRTYDPDPTTGDVRSVTDQDGVTTSFGYNADGNLEWITDPSLPIGPGIENRTIFAVDRAGRVRRATNPLGHWVEYDHDAANLPTAVRTLADQANGRVINTGAAYDAMGRLYEATDGKGQITHTVYDPNGEAREVYVAWGTAQQGRVLYERDANGNVARRTDADGLLTTYEYDANDLPLRMLTPKPDTKTNNITTYDHDANGNLISLIDLNGRTTTYAHDARDRLKTVNYPAQGTTAPAFSVGYTHDVTGNRKTMTDPTSGETRYAYDALGRLTAVTAPALQTSVNYAYDLTDAGCPVGKGTRLTYPRGQQVTSCHDQVGRLTTVRDWDGRETGYTYDEAGRLATMQYPNNTRGIFTFDAADRFLGVTYERTVAASAVNAFTDPATATTAAPTGTPTPAGTPAPDPDPSAGAARAGTIPLPPGLDRTEMRLRFAQQATQTGVFFSQVYALDDAGNRTRATEPESWPTTNGVTTHIYDAQDRLKQVTYPGGTRTDVYAYSANGHRESVTTNGVATPYAYNGAKRLASTGSGGRKVTYGHDASGNQTARGNDTFAYDGAHRLRKAVSKDPTTGLATTATYDYDGDGLRLRETVGGLAERSIWDVNRALPVVLDDGAWLYVYGLGDAPIMRAPISQLQAGKVYFHADGLGSVRAATGPDGGGQAYCDYAAFGEAFDLDTACPAEVAFAGQGRDRGTGWYHLRARQYDPATGRFAAPDPTGYAGGDNLYAYAGNNPATYTDPAGTTPTDPLSGKRAEGVAPIRSRAVGPTGKGRYDSEKRQGIYVLKDVDGVVRYVGRGDVPVRFLKHAKSAIKRMFGRQAIANNNLNTAEARGLEELLMQHFGGPRKYGGKQLMNAYRGIQPGNPARNEYLDAGRPLLKEALDIIEGR